MVDRPRPNATFLLPAVGLLPPVVAQTYQRFVHEQAPPLEGFIAANRTFDLGESMRLLRRFAQHCPVRLVPGLPSPEVLARARSVIVDPVIVYATQPADPAWGCIVGEAAALRHETTVNSWWAACAFGAVFGIGGLTYMWHLGMRPWPVRRSEPTVPAAPAPPVHDVEMAVREPDATGEAQPTENEAAPLLPAAAPAST